MSKNVNGVAWDYLLYLLVIITLIRNCSKNYKFNFYLHFNVTTSPSS